MPMTPVEFFIVTPKGEPISNATVEIQLGKAAFNAADDGVVLPRLETVVTGVDGKATIELWPSDEFYYASTVDPVSGAEMNYKFKVPAVADGVVARLQDLVVLRTGCGGSGSNPGSGSGETTTLAADLLNTTSPSKGAGMVKVGATTTYLRDTVGAEVRNVNAQAEHFWLAVDANQRNLRIVVTGDSTGVGEDRWVYLFANWLRLECPQYTVKYRTFNDTTRSWNAYATLQLGTGPALPFAGDAFTIFIDNGSVSGTNSFYTMGGRESGFWRTDSITPDLVLYNYGHNLGTQLSEKVMTAEVIVGLSHIRQMAPNAAIIAMLQNPRASAGSDIATNGSAFSSRMVAAVRKAVEQVGAGLIDIYTAYKTHANYSSLMLDEVHPNSAGQQVILDEVKRGMAKPTRYSGDAPMAYNPLAEQRPNFAPNPRFISWSGVSPDDWTCVNCTATKDTGLTDGSLYSTRLTVTGANAQFYTDVSHLISHLAGKVVSMTVRVRRSTGMGALAGCAEIASTNNVDSSDGSISYDGRTDVSAGGFEYMHTTFTVPRNHNQMVLRIYAGGAGSGDIGKFINVDQVWFGLGTLPGNASLEGISNKFVLEYYGDGNVGKVAGTTGTLTAAGGVVTLSGASGASDIFVNIPGPTKGKRYKISFYGQSYSGSGSHGGNWYLRSGFDGGFTNIATSSWTEGAAANLEFVHAGGPISVQVAGYTGTTGFVLNNWSIKPVESGLVRPINLPLNAARNVDGSSIASTAAGGNLGISQSFTAATFLRGRDVQAGTALSDATDAACWEFTLPDSYIAGRDLTVTVNARYVGTGNANGAKSVTVDAYSLSDTTGTHTALTVSAPLNMTNSAADMVFSVSGTGLSPGVRVILKIAARLTEGGSMNPLYSKIASVKVS